MYKSYIVINCDVMQSHCDIWWCTHP